MIFQNKTRRTKLCDGSHKDTVSDKDLMRHFVCFAFSQSEKSLQILKKAVCALSHSVVSDTLVTPWTVAHQAPLSMGFPRQEYWSRVPLPSPGDLSDPGIEPKSPALADSFFTPEPR